MIAPALAIVGVMSSSATAQSNAASQPWVVVGGGWVDDIGGFGFEMELGAHQRRMFFGARVLYAKELCVLWCSDLGYLLAFGPVVGFRGGSRYMKAHLNTGVSFTSGRWDDSSEGKWSEVDSKARVGVPVEAALIFTPSRSFGIGAAGFRDFNAKHAYSGIIVFIVFGE